MGATMLFLSELKQTFIYNYRFFVNTYLYDFENPLNVLVAPITSAHVLYWKYGNTVLAQIVPVGKANKSNGEF